MMTLLTGTPGAGKSLYATKLILELIAENERVEKTPIEKRKDSDIVRPIFTDIAGFDHERFGTQVSPEDWTTAPVGSVIFYDECQKKFGPDTKGGRSGRDDIRAMEEHRHKGVDLFFITQRETLLHAHVRALIGRHYHLQRINGAKAVNVFKAEEGVIKTTSPASLKRCDSSTWVYDKKLFDCYKSSELHTHKFTMPKWLRNGLFIIAACLLLLVFAFKYAMGFFTGDAVVAAIQGGDSEQIQKSNISKTDTIDNTIIQESLEPDFQGCVATTNYCRCYLANGAVADISRNECVLEIVKPYKIEERGAGRSERQLFSRSSERENENDLGVATHD